MQAKDIKHGIVVSGHMSEQWEVLDRHPKNNFWWLHRRDSAGGWITSYAHITELQPVNSGSRQESLLTEGN